MRKRETQEAGGLALVYVSSGQNSSEVRSAPRAAAGISSDKLMRTPLTAIRTLPVQGMFTQQASARMMTLPHVLQKWEWDGPMAGWPPQNTEVSRGVTEGLHT